MSEILIFVMGSVFGLALLCLALAMVSNMAASAQPLFAAAGQGAMQSDVSCSPRASYASASPKSARPTTGQKPALRLAPPKKMSAAEREAYRVSSRLQRAEQALRSIAELSSEAAAAKIAAQTLRRMARGGEPPRARLSFALSRLDLLSLRAEPRARAAACDALRAMCG